MSAGFPPISGEALQAIAGTAPSLGVTGGGFMDRLSGLLQDPQALGALGGLFGGGAGGQQQQAQPQGLPSPQFPTLIQPGSSGPLQDPFAAQPGLAGASSNPFDFLMALNNPRFPFPQ